MIQEFQIFCLTTHRQLWNMATWWLLHLVVPLSMCKYQVSNGIVTVRGTVRKSPLKQECITARVTVCIWQSCSPGKMMHSWHDCEHGREEAGGCPFMARSTALTQLFLDVETQQMEETVKQVSSRNTSPALPLRQYYLKFKCLWYD